MLRSWTWVWFWAAGLFLGVGALSAQAARPSENLLPNTSTGFLAVSNVEKLADHWKKTQLGQLMADPVMEPFTTSLRQQFEGRWSGVRERLGLTLEDLKDVPGGEVAVALILRRAPEEGAPDEAAEDKESRDEAALAIVVDVTGHVPQATALLEKISENLKRQGAKETRHAVAGTTVFLFDIPEPEEDKEIGPRKAVYFLTDNLLGASDDLEVIQGILARIPGDQGDSLADVPGFQVVMKRCAKDAGEAVPQIRWFIDPLAYVRTIRAATPENRRRKGKSVLEVLRNQGLGAIQGVGGFVDFAAEGYELVHRTAVHAPPPHDKSMKMLVFPNGPEYAPQRWVPRDIATYTTFYVDILNAFDNVGPLFDELFGEGEEDIWEEVLEQLREDPNGPQIDLRKDLVVHLGQRVTVITDYQLPITTTSERLLFAIETTDPEALAKTIKKSMENDPTAKRREIKGQIIWEIVEEEEQPEIPTVTLDDLPSLIPDDDEEKEEEEEEDVRLLPHAAVTVAYGHLFVASHIDFLLKVLEPVEERETLGYTVDHRRIDDAVEQLEIAGKCARMFSRTDEEYRPTYELIRQGKMPESQTVLGRLLNAMFGEGKKGVIRPQKIEGKALPDYDVVRRSLGPAGLVVTSVHDETTNEPWGWFFKGFTLKKGSP